MYKCPKCNRVFLAGIVDGLNGEIYKCTYCNRWFKEVHKTMVRVKLKTHEVS